MFVFVNDKLNDCFTEISQQHDEFIMKSTKIVIIYWCYIIDTEWYAECMLVKAIIILMFWNEHMNRTTKDIWSWFKSFCFIVFGKHFMRKKRCCDVEAWVTWTKDREKREEMEKQHALTFHLCFFSTVFRFFLLFLRLFEVLCTRPQWDAAVPNTTLFGITETHIPEVQMNRFCTQVRRGQDGMMRLRTTPARCGATMMHTTG